MFRYVIAFLLLINTAIADIKVDVVKTKVLSGLKEPQLVNNLVLFEESSQPNFSAAAKIKITTDAKFNKVKARKSLFETTEVIKLSNTEYLLVGSGKYAVEVTTFDPEKGIDETTVSIDLGDAPTPSPTPPDPVPTPGPDPVPPNPVPIPDDKFDNIGKRAFEWSAGLPKRAELAAVYKEASERLKTLPQVTTNDASKFLVEERKKLLGVDEPKYSDFVNKINADLGKRWPMPRQEFVLYLYNISLGLGGL
jgi:hypothetical protein